MHYAKIAIKMLGICHCKPTSHVGKKLDPVIL